MYVPWPYLIPPYLLLAALLLSNREARKNRRIVLGTTLILCTIILISLVDTTFDTFPDFSRATQQVLYGVETLFFFGLSFWGVSQLFQGIKQSPTLRIKSFLRLLTILFMLYGAMYGFVTFLSAMSATTFIT